MRWAGLERRRGWMVVGGVSALTAAVLVGAGCEQVIGLNKFHDVLCAAGDKRACYGGAEGTEGVGVCKGGTQTCSDDGMSWGDCVGEVIPATGEDCGNNLDDDCNGVVNDACTCVPGTTAACYSGSELTKDVGICHGGTQTCNEQGTGYGACIGEQTPKAEDCSTTVDDNCDGSVNEAAANCGCIPGEMKPCYTGPMNTEGVGICSGGMQACNADGLGYGPCTGDVLPAVEDCSNAIDDDCDGYACSRTLWAKDLGVATYGYGIAKMAADPSNGDVYVAGGYWGSIKFGGTTLIASGGMDIFVAKLDASGTAIWAKSFGSPSMASIDYPVALATDSLGNVFVASSGDHGDGTNVMKLDASGNKVWSKACGTSSTHLTPATNGLAVDSQGNVVLAGGFYGTLAASSSLDCAGAVMNTTSPTNQDMMLVKLSGADGAPLWAKQFGGTGNQQANAVTVDAADNIYVSGLSYEGFSFGTPGALLSHPGGSKSIGFTVKLTGGGSPIFASGFGDTNGATAGDITVDSTGRLLLSGTYRGTLAVAGVASIINSSSTSHGYLAMLNAAGNGLWLKDTGPLTAFVASDSKGNVVVSGTLNGSTTFGGASLDSVGGSADIAVAKLDAASGAVLWQRLFGDANQQTVTGLRLGKGDEVILAGNFLGTLTFDAASLVATATGTDTNMFLAAVAP